MEPSNDKLTYREDVSWLIKTQDPVLVFEEVKRTLGMFMPDFDLREVEQCFDDTVSLFRGTYPGYRACNTEYHDLKHTTDVFLALASLFHGYSLCGEPLKPRTVRLSLIAALMHDSGYIQAHYENLGTGARFTEVHVERSIAFLEEYFKRTGWDKDDYRSAARMVIATDLKHTISDIPFKSEAEAQGAKALFVADVLGQMADRVYLEKLLFLYQEFSEAGTLEYSSEQELLEKTVGFYEMAWKKLINEAGYKEEHLHRHFEVRWGIPRDLYAHAADKNIDFLQYILKNHKNRHREMLNRGGLVSQLMNKDEEATT